MRRPPLSLQSTPTTNFTNLKFTLTLHLKLIDLCTSLPTNLIFMVCQLSVTLANVRLRLNLRLKQKQKLNSTTTMATTTGTTMATTTATILPPTPLKHLVTLSTQNHLPIHPPTPM